MYSFAVVFLMQAVRFDIWQVLRKSVKFCFEIYEFHTLKQGVFYKI